MFKLADIHMISDIIIMRAILILHKTRSVQSSSSKFFTSIAWQNSHSHDRMSLYAIYSHSFALHGRTCNLQFSCLLVIHSTQHSHFCRLYLTCRHLLTESDYTVQILFLLVFFYGQFQSYKLQCLICVFAFGPLRIT